MVLYDKVKPKERSKLGTLHAHPYQVGFIPFVTMIIAKTRTH